MKEIISRFAAESPLIFKRIIYWCIGLGAIGGTILATPDMYHSWLVSVADDMIKIGAAAALVAGLTRKDPPKEG